MRDIQIFCDFDGTVTKEDTLNKFLRIYADKEWLNVESKWEAGKIGSRECIFEQMKLVPRQNAKVLNDFLNGIEIDEYFPEFIKYVRENNIDFYIVSDGFDYFINRILRKNNIFDIKIFANHVNLEDGRYICGFPYTNPDCTTASGMCKCNIVNKYKRPESTVLYIGDGGSDFCVSKKMETIFAKGRLLEYCEKNNIAENGLIRFSCFKEILNFLKQGE